MTDHETLARNALDPLVMGLGYAAIAVFIYLAVGYRNATSPGDPVFVQCAIQEALFASAGLLMAGILARRAPRPPAPQQVTALAITFGITLIIDACIMAVFPYTLPASDLSVSRVDGALFTIFAGPAEALFFQGTLLNLLALGQASKPRKGLAVVGSAGIFALAHSFVHDVPAYLGAQFVLGVSWGIAYLFWNDLAPVVLAHMVKNITTLGFPTNLTVATPLVVILLARWGRRKTRGAHNPENAGANPALATIYAQKR